MSDTPTPTDPREEKQMRPCEHRSDGLCGECLTALNKYMLEDEALTDRRIMSLESTNSNLAAEIAELKAQKRPFSDKLADEVIKGQVKRISELETSLATLRAELEAARKERDLAQVNERELRHQRDESDVRRIALRDERDTALAAKDAAEKALNRAFWVMEAQAEGEEPIGSAEFWQVEAGKIAAVLPAALTPAPTQEPPACPKCFGTGWIRKVGGKLKCECKQEPPAGGVTISNETVGIIPTATTPTEASPDVSALGVEAASHPISTEKKGEQHGPSERLVEQTQPLTNSPADVPSEGRGEWMPIETAPKDGTYILLLGDSGYLTTPWRVNVGAWKPGFRDAWVDHANDRITDGGTEPTHWLPLDAFMLPPEGSGATKRTDPMYQRLESAAKAMGEASQRGEIHEHNWVISYTGKTRMCFQCWKFESITPEQQP